MQQGTSTPTPPPTCHYMVLCLPAAAQHSPLISTDCFLLLLLLLLLLLSSYCQFFVCSTMLTPSQQHVRSIGPRCAWLKPTCAARHLSSTFQLRTMMGNACPTCAVRLVLYCTVLHCTGLFCTALWCTVLYCGCTGLFCTEIVDWHSATTQCACHRPTHSV